MNSDKNGDTNIIKNNSYSKITDVNRGITMNDQLHDQLVMPFHSVYLGFVTIFQTENIDQTTDCGLVWSLDTQHWFRLGGYHTNDANIIHRNVDSNDFDSHLCFAGAFPVDINNETRFYYQGANNTFFPGTERQSAMGFATLRQDGFAGLTNKDPMVPANLISQQFEVDGKYLIVTVDVYEGGDVKIGLTDNENVGNKTINNCISIQKNVTNYRVGWKGGDDLSYLKGQKLKVEIELNNAVLYTYGIVNT